MTAWDVRYTREFNELLLNLPDSAYDHVEASIDILAANPGLARDYDPVYDAARPRTPAASTTFPGRQR